MNKKFQISTDIYSLEKIQQAILDFSDVCEIISLQEIIHINGESEEEIQEIFNEFINYLLSL